MSVVWSAHDVNGNLHIGHDEIVQHRRLPKECSGVRATGRAPGTPERIAKEYRNLAREWRKMAERVERGGF
jgi:hypothetical protein